MSRTATTSILDMGPPTALGTPSTSIMTPSVAPMQQQTAITPPVAAPNLRPIGDVKATRAAIYDRVFKAATTMAPVSNQRHTLRLTNVAWADSDTFTKKQRKEAILSGRTMGRRLKGTWELLDNATQNVLDSKAAVLATVPHLTEGGTFVDNGNEYALKNQQRLRAGAFARNKDNGEVETYTNVLKGGPSHRYFLDPEKGAFYLKVGTTNVPLLPLLQSLGAEEKEIRDAWGDELYASNYQKADGSSISKIVERVLKGKVGEGEKPQDAIRAAFEKMELDPVVTRKTLGQPYDRVNKDVVLGISKKLLAISRKEAEPDDRDHLAFAQFLGPEDLFGERLEKDRAGVRRQLLYKASYKGNLQRMPSSALQSQITSAILESGLGQALEEINPAEILDKNTQISRMGEGGIPSYDAIPDEARAVQPSHFGFMDPLRTPESFRAGVDVFLSGNIRKGDDGRLYAPFTDAKTGKEVYKNPQEVADNVVTFPGAMKLPGKRVPAMKDGRLTWVPKTDVNLVLPHMEYAFSPLGQMVPLKSMVKGQRVAMATRMTTQALPLVNAEAPLVQNAMPGTNGQKSFEEEYASHMGAVKADQPGRVVAVSDDAITVKYDDGRTDEVELYNNFPYNRKTGITQTAIVQPGQRFTPGQLLAKSNFTDGSGASALGINARVAYLPWAGKNFEDAIVVSDSMAKRLSSQHMYQHGLDVTDKHRTGRNAYVSLFPSRYDRKTLDKLDDKGVIKPGTEVHYGDPLILAAHERSTAQNKIHKKGSPAFQDASITWEHEDPGVVTDVVQGKNGPVVLVKSQHPMQVGDKMSGRYGDKGVVSAIIPDHQMPAGTDGKPYEVLLNPLGVISRTNPAQWAEAALGKIAAKLGKPVKIEDWDETVPDRTEWVMKQLAAHGLKDTEDLIDPENERKIPGVYTGNRFFMKLHHTSESKGQGRSGGSYAADETPAKGGPEGSKRISLLDTNALLSHGATEVLRDAGAIRGQRNEEYWLQFMQGHTPRAPKVPLVHKKFVDELKASGINVVRNGSQLNIMAMTDKDVDHLAGDREIGSGDTVDLGDDLKPAKGGLFDTALTGGHHGNRWSAIKLHEPMPNPVMEEPIRRVLGLTKDKFEDVLAGRERLPTGTGPSAIANALNKIDLNRELLLARHQVKEGTKGVRDAAIRRLGYLKSAERLGIHPGEWMMKRVPVLPPQFRPINVIEGSGTPLVADPNFLYKELIEANKNLGDMSKSVGDSEVGDERLAVYHAFKAVSGLGDPITEQSKEKQVKGILKTIFGSSPKLGTVQRKLISSTVDNVGRAVISPNPDLDMDTVGLPEDRAFDVYSRFVVRRLRRSGMPITRALEHVNDRTPLARKMLVQEMDERPVIINRAPVLHRFGIMAFRPTLTKGSTLQVSPLIVKGFNADFDGDAMQYHVPTDEAARLETLDRMLPSRQLLSPGDFKSPVHVPGQEYVGGLYHASTHRSERKHTFRSKSDAIKAWRSGRVGIGDDVTILEDDKESK